MDHFSSVRRHTKTTHEPWQLNQHYVHSIFIYMNHKSTFNQVYHKEQFSLSISQCQYYRSIMYIRYGKYMTNAGYRIVIHTYYNHHLLHCESSIFQYLENKFCNYDIQYVTYQRCNYVKTFELFSMLSQLQLHVALQMRQRWKG